MQNNNELLYERVISTASVKFSDLTVEQKKYLAAPAQRNKLSSLFSVKDNVYEAKENWCMILKGLFREGFINE